MPTPDVLCSQCGTPLEILECEMDGCQDDPRGWADAQCVSCGGWWRYVYSLALGWSRAINLRNYHAWNAKPGSLTMPLKWVQLEMF